MPKQNEYTCIAKCSLPVQDKAMELLAFSAGDSPEPEAVALVHGYRRHATHAAIVRFHSACFTGDVLGSEKCDCGPQLHAALEMITRSPWGILVYFLRHEGRGIGLTSKMRAYALQDDGYDTVTANTELHEPIDSREYRSGVAILNYLGAKRIWLVTNNPEKIQAIAGHGIRVEGAKTVNTAVTRFNKQYLTVKRNVFRHQLLADAVRAG